MSDKPNILIWDIETSYSVIADFGIGRRNFQISYDNILSEWYIICAAWKWLGEDKVHTVSVLDDPRRFKKNPSDDLFVCKTLHEQLDKADIIVAHNGDKFDTKKCNARLWYHDIPPYSPVRSVDTYKAARNSFNLSSNRLDYLAQFKGFQGKLESKGLWLRVLQGEKAAIEEMVAYNKVDVDELEKIYLSMRPWIHNHPNLSSYTRGCQPACPRCDSDDLQKRGFAYTNAGKFQRYHCNSCKSWSRGRENLLSKKHTDITPSSYLLHSQ